MAESSSIFNTQMPNFNSSSNSYVNALLGMMKAEEDRRIAAKNLEENRAIAQKNREEDLAISEKRWNEQQARTLQHQAEVLAQSDRHFNENKKIAERNRAEDVAWKKQQAKIAADQWQATFGLNKRKEDRAVEQGKETAGFIGSVLSNALTTQQIPGITITPKFNNNNVLTGFSFNGSKEDLENLYSQYNIDEKGAFTPKNPNDLNSVNFARLMNQTMASGDTKELSKAYFDPITQQRINSKQGQLLFGSKVAELGLNIDENGLMTVAHDKANDPIANAMANMYDSSKGIFEFNRNNSKAANLATVLDRDIVSALNEGLITGDYTRYNDLRKTRAAAETQRAVKDNEWKHDAEKEDLKDIYKVYTDAVKFVNENGYNSWLFDSSKGPGIRSDILAKGYDLARNKIIDKSQLIKIASIVKKPGKNDWWNSYNDVSELSNFLNSLSGLTSGEIDEKLSSFLTGNTNLNTKVSNKQSTNPNKSSTQLGTPINQSPVKVNDNDPRVQALVKNTGVSVEGAVRQVEEEATKEEEERQKEANKNYERMTYQRVHNIFKPYLNYSIFTNEDTDMMNKLEKLDEKNKNDLFNKLFTEVSNAYNIPENVMKNILISTDKTNSIRILQRILKDSYATN